MCTSSPLALRPHESGGRLSLQRGSSGAALRPRCAMRAERVWPAACPVSVCLLHVALLSAAAWQWPREGRFGQPGAVPGWHGLRAAGLEPEKLHRPRAQAPRAGAVHVLGPVLGSRLGSRLGVSLGSVPVRGFLQCFCLSVSAGLGSFPITGLRLVAAEAPWATQLSCWRAEGRGGAWVQCSSGPVGLGLSGPFCGCTD